MNIEMEEKKRKSQQFKLIGEHTDDDLNDSKEKFDDSAGTNRSIDLLSPK